MDIELLQKYLKGDCSAEEAKQVKTLLDEDPSLLEAYLQQAATEPVQTPMPAGMEAALLASFRKEWLPGSSSVSNEAVIKPMPAARNWLKWSAVAAILAGVVVLGWLSGVLNTHDYVTFEGQAGIIRQVSLPDHSLAWLKPGAKLRFDQKAYNGSQRVIELQQGEAFFEVVHKAASPFIVQTGNIATTDIGTSFDVRSDAATGRVEVTVATGEVAVSYNQQTLAHLLPGKQISVAATGRFTLQQLPSWMAALWKENSLQLNNVSFAELSMAMQQLYGVKMQTQHKHIGQQTYTIQLKRQTPVSQVVKVICLLNQNQYRKEADGSYLIY